MPNTEIERVLPPKPEYCLGCKGTDFWWREWSELGGAGHWVCQRCHPRPITLGVVPNPDKFDWNQVYGGKP